MQPPHGVCIDFLLCNLHVIFISRCIGVPENFLPSHFCSPRVKVLLVNFAYVTQMSEWDLFHIYLLMLISQITGNPMVFAKLKLKILVIAILVSKLSKLPLTQIYLKHIQNSFCILISFPNYIYFTFLFHYMSELLLIVFT